MREILPITAFNKGIACGVDVEDAHPESCIMSTDVDAAAPQGVLRGRLADSDVLDSAADDAFFFPHEGSWDMIYRAGDDLHLITDFYGTPVVSTLKTNAGVAEGMVASVRGKSVFVGCGKNNPPLWIGYTPWKHFGVADDGSMSCVSSECSALAGNTAALWSFQTVMLGNPGGFFKTSRSYHYSYCLVYDGYLRSPLANAVHGVGNENAINPAQDSESLSVHMIFEGIGELANLNKRITALELYRADSDDPDITVVPSSSFALVGTLDLTTVPAYGVGTNGWTYDPEPDPYGFYTANNRFTFRDFGDAFFTYESQSGIPETVSSNTLKYGIAAEANGMLFVGQCAHPEIAESSTMMFRSKPYRFGMFNWAEDYLILPFAPVAMAAWGGKLYVAGEGSMVRVEPSTMSIEETINGIGVAGPRSMVSVEAGLFIMSQNNVYMISARGMTPIGDAIRTHQESALCTPVSLASVDADTPPVLGWEARHGLLLCVVKYGSSQFGVFVYDVSGGVWWFWTVTASDNGGVITGKSGEAYLATAESIIHLCGGATRKECEFVSPFLTFGRASQRKKVYKIKRSGSGTISYATDEAASWTPLEGSDGNELVAADWLCTRLQYKASVAAGEELKSLEVVYRHMEGFR